MIAVWQFRGGALPTEAQSRHRLARKLSAADETPQRRFPWLALRRADDALLGTMTLHVCDGSAELSYAFGAVHWGQGYATEAAGAALSFAFAELGLRQVWATAELANVASWRVMEKLGLQRVAPPAARPDDVVEFVRYQLDRPAWLAR